MKIAGFQRTTLLDYPGKIASTIFLDRCNFKCGFCHNPDLVTNIDQTTFIDDIDVLDLLEQRKHLVEAVTITGGEPCLHSGLYDLIYELKERKFFVKLDTNGAFPKVLEKLLKNNLIDYIAMDIKTRLVLEKYNDVAGVNVDIRKIHESISLIKNSDIDYEFRMTVVPALISKQDILSVGEFLNGSKKFVIQQFVNDQKMIDSSLINSKMYEPDEIKEFASKLKNYFEKVEIRGI